MESRYRYVEFGHYRVGSRIITPQTSLNLFGFFCPEPPSSFIHHTEYAPHNLKILNCGVFLYIVESILVITKTKVFLDRPHLLSTGEKNGAH